MNLFPLNLEHHTYNLTGPDGNAYVILGSVSSIIKRTLRMLKAKSHEIEAVLETYREEATSGDYEHLLEVTKRYVLLNFIY